MFNTDSFGNIYFPAGVSVGNYPTITTTPTHVLVAGAGGRISRVAISQLTSSSPVTSVFGRTGAVVAIPGDYDTDTIKENTNLYFTVSRARASISLTALGTTGPATYDPVTGVINVPQYQNEFSGVNTFNTRVGDVVLTALDVTTALTYTPIGVETDPVWGAQKVLYYTKVESDALFALVGHTHTTTEIAEGTNLYFTTARARAALSAGTGISYNNTTGVITNSAPDQTVVLTQGAGISITGTYPSFTIASTITQYTDALARASISGGTGISYNSVSGVITNTITQYTNALARLSISLTTNGTTGVSTYNSSTGVFNIPNYTTDLTGYATESYVNTQVSGLVDAAPTTLNTLNELAAALGDDPNFATTVTNLIGTKEPIITPGTTAQYWRGDKSWQTLPIYTLSGLGGVPTTRTLSINGIVFDLSENRSWTINSMVYPPAGIAVSTGSSWAASITDNSSNWNAAFADRMKWDGGSVGLNAATGRTSLGLGTAALANTGDFAAASHTHIIANVTGLQTALDGKENAFTKNTGFNKNFGNTAGTVTEGDDIRLSNARTPLAHTHPISDITGLQTALDGKAPSVHTHTIANVTGLQTALDGKEATITAGTTSQYFRGDKTFQTLPIYTLAGLGGQPQLNGTGFVKASGTTISYDNSTYYLASNPSSYITGITSLMVTTALGYTPYNASNPNGYITSASIGNGTLTLNVSGNGLSGSTSFTANQSSGSTFTVTSNATTSATANTLVYRDSGADIYARYFFGSYINTSDNDESGITRFIIKNVDNYHRSATTTVAANIIRGVASGTWSINITGNAETVDGFSASQSTVGNNIVVRDPNGYIFGNYINMSDDGNPGGGTSISSFITKQGDNYYRSVSPTNAMVSIRGVASGTWGIDITGSAANANALGGHAASTYVGKFGNVYYQVNTWLQFNGAYGLYWPNDNGCHIYPNSATTYTQFRFDGVRNGYSGVYLADSGVNGMMYDISGNGGVYKESIGRWYFYYHVGNDCMGVGTSSTSSTYSLYLNKGIYAQAGSLMSGISTTNYLTASNCALAVTGIAGQITLTTSTGFGGYFRATEHIVIENTVGGYHVYVLDQSGTGVVKFAGAQSWSAHSDARIKTVHSTLKNSLSKLDGINPIYYSFNNFDDNKNRIGLIAQEVQAYFPELVNVDPKTNNLTLDYTGLIPVLLGAIKELKDKVEILERQL